ncbi:MAG: hypothetical protein ACOCRK_02245 [bacterium]
MAENKKRKSKIRKSISRLISTGEFENVHITVDIEEEIEWQNVNERMEKTQNINKILVTDMINTIKTTLKDLKLNKKISNIKKRS